MHWVPDLRFALLESMSSLGAARILASREARWNSLGVETVHGYPEQAVGMPSRSRFELRDARG